MHSQREKKVQKQYQVRKNKLIALIEHFRENHDSYNKKECLKKENYDYLQKVLTDCN